MKVNYYLKKNKISKDGMCPVLLQITVNSEKIRKQIPDVKVLIKDWKSTDQRIKPNSKNEKYNFHIEFNNILDSKESEIKKVFQKIYLENIENPVKYISDSLNKNETTESFTFFEVFNLYIESNVLTKSKNTIKKYYSTLNFLKNFDAYSNYELNFNSINNEFMQLFRDYCFTEKNTLNNYYGKIIAIIKTFMDWSHENNYHSNIAYKKFKKIADDIEVIYLTKEELLLLLEFDFKSNRLSQVRDLYCFACFTGLRFSDLSSLQSSNIFEDYIKLTIQKTKTIDHIIPLNKYAIAILDKYNNTIYKPLPTISAQKFNSYIKECCQLAGIDTPTTTTRYIGQKRIDKTQPKYELITSHTARKTFVTNSLIFGMPEMVVRNITGHKKEETFRKYVKIAEDYKKEQLQKAWEL